MKNKIIFSLLLISYSTVFAQQPSNSLPSQQNSQSQTLPQKNTKEEAKDVNYTKEEINKLNEHLSKDEYQEFFSLIQKTKVSKNNYIEFLLSKKHEGRVPLYWLMADYYAKEKNELETHKWLYIALIMTQQDSFLCKDESAKNAPRKLMEFFPDAVYLSRTTPRFIEQAMREVSFFIPNLKQRISPEWACYYGTKPNTKSKPELIDKLKWTSERERIFNKFMSSHQK